MIFIYSKSKQSDKRHYLWATGLSLKDWSVFESISCLPRKYWASIGLSPNGDSPSDSRFAPNYWASTGLSPNGELLSIPRLAKLLWAKIEDLFISESRSNSPVNLAQVRPGKARKTSKSQKSEIWGKVVIWAPFVPWLRNDQFFGLFLPGRGLES